MKLATTINEFFGKKIETLKKEIPPAQTDPNGKLRESMKDRICTFIFNPVSPKEVEQAIKSLKTSKSAGSDEISSDIFKIALPVILPAVTHVINLSLIHGVFPSVWKHAKVTPLLKKGDSLS